MIPIDKVRIIEILVGGEWVRAQFDQVEKGDFYRMFEPDGTPIVANTACGCPTEHTVFLAEDCASITTRLLTTEELVMHLTKDVTKGDSV